MITYQTPINPRKYFFVEEIEEDISNVIDTRNGVSALFHEDTHEFFLDFDIASTTSSLNY